MSRGLWSLRGGSTPRPKVLSNFRLRVAVGSLISQSRSRHLQCGKTLHHLISCEGWENRVHAARVDVPPRVYANADTTTRSSSRVLHFTLCEFHVRRAHAPLVDIRPAAVSTRALSRTSARSPRRQARPCARLRVAGICSCQPRRATPRSTVMSFRANSSTAERVPPMPQHGSSTVTRSGTREEDAEAVGAAAAAAVGGSVTEQKDVHPRRSRRSAAGARGL